MTAKRQRQTLRLPDFLQSVLILVSGAIGAQVILLLVSPILTRLYSPEEFALFGLFLSLLGCVVPAINGKLDAALVVAESDDDSKYLLHAGLITNISFAVVLGLALLVVLALNLEASWLADLGAWVLSVPAGASLSGILYLYYGRNNRGKQYTKTANAKLILATFTAILSVIFGYLSVPNGLIPAYFFSLLLAVALILPNLIPFTLPDAQFFFTAYASFKKYIRFPKYSASTGVLDGMTAALPMLFLSHYFALEVAGYFALISRIIIAPLSLLSIAISQVHLRRMSELVRVGGMLRYMATVSCALFAVALTFAVFSAFIAPHLFADIFGEEWADAGPILEVLSASIAIKFMVSTLSASLWVTNGNRLEGSWKVIAFIATLITLSIVAPAGDAMWFFAAIAILDVALYCLYYAKIWYSVLKFRGRSE